MAIEDDENDKDAVRPAWGQVGRVATLAAIAAASKIYLNLLNTTTIIGEDRFHKAALERDPDQGLLTVSNHTSTTDDPAVIAAMLPWRAFYTSHYTRSVRWSLCAREICYRNLPLRHFFRNGQVLPIDRGRGTGQPIMGTAAALLAGGAWVHVFPEGRVGYSGRLEPCRWGVGRLLCDAVKTSGRDPIVVPFYHSGMPTIQPRHSTIPSVGHRLHIAVGEPLEMADLTCRCGDPSQDQQQVWIDITARIRTALQELESQCPPNACQLADGETPVREPAGQRQLKSEDPVLPESGNALNNRTT